MLGDLALDLLDDGVGQLIVEITLGFTLKALCDLLLELVAILGDGILLGYILDEIIVYLGELLGLDLMELDLENSVLALEVLRLILLGELDVDIELVAGVVADDLLLKAGDEVAGAELEVIFLRLAALERLAVAEALEVDDNGVAVLCGTILNGDHAAVALTNAVDLLVDHLVGDLGGELLDLDAVIVLDLDLGLNNDGRLEGEAFLRHVGRLETGDGDDLQACCLARLVQRLGIAILHRIVIENILAVHLLDDGAGRFTLAEAGNSELLRLFFEYLRNSLHKGFAVYLYLYLIGVGCS